MTYPSWWAFALLVLGAFRVTRLVGWDDLTIGPRRRLTGMGDEEHKQWAYVIDHQHEAGYDPWDYDSAWGDWQNQLGELVHRLRCSAGSDKVPPLIQAQIQDGADPPVSPRRYYLSKMVRCPWCAGFWISLAFAVAWGGASDAWLSGVLLAFPLSATVGLLAKNLDP